MILLVLMRVDIDDKHIDAVKATPAAMLDLGRAYNFISVTPYNPPEEKPSAGGYQPLKPTVTFRGDREEMTKKEHPS